MSRWSEQSLSPGEVVEVVVTHLAPFGARVDYLGVGGLVNIPELSWGRISHPADVVVPGQLIRVLVLAVNANGFSASLRAVHPEQNPWRDPDIFAIGTVLEAAVVRVSKYGCFVEIRPEVWALLRGTHWSGAVVPGDRLRVRIETVDADARKIEVSLVDLGNSEPGPSR